MKITIDCRHLKSSGIGVYLRECLPYFLSSSNTFLLIGNNEDIFKLVSSKIIANNYDIIDCNIKPFSIEELFLFPRKIIKDINKTDLFYSPYFNFPCNIKIPVFLTIHDIIFPDMPELISKAGLFIRMFFFRRAVRAAQKIFTVSEFSKSRLIHYFGEKKPVIVTYSALQSNFLEPGLKAIKKDKTILFIGNIKKHKGLFILLEAFLQAHKEGLEYKLIIAGSNDNIRTKDNDILNQLKNIDSSIVDFTGFISDIELKNLLRKSGLLIQPSLYEGFCLPPLEAMASGTKALISDIPVLKEVYSEYPVVFFQSGNALDLKIKMMELLYKKNPESILLPTKLLEKYNFAKTASIILKELTGKAS